MIIRRARKASCRQLRNTRVGRFTRLLPPHIYYKHIVSNLNTGFNSVSRCPTNYTLLSASNGGSNGDVCELIKKYQGQRFLLM